MTYKTDSDIWTPYYPQSFVKAVLKQARIKISQQINGASFIQFNCESLSNRERMLHEFQKHFKVDSLGKCCNNKYWGPNNKTVQDKIAILSNYKFHLAWENQYSAEYVTEKVYHSLLAGSIPVYVGPLDITRFVPPDSIIDARKFSFNMSLLADYLNHLLRNETALNRYHTWRSESTLLKFEKIFSGTKTSKECRVCRFLLAKKYGQNWDKKEQTITPTNTKKKICTEVKSKRNARRLSLYYFIRLKNTKDLKMRL